MTATEYNLAIIAGTVPLEYEKWRHGGWYTNVRYPSGAGGCVSRNYADKKWRIACDPRDFDTAPTFRNRDEAAKAEAALILSGHHYEDVAE